MEVTVDLGARTITAREVVVPFEVDEYQRYRLINGLDDVDITLTHEDDILGYEQARPAFLPTTV